MRSSIMQTGRNTVVYIVLCTLTSFCIEVSSQAQNASHSTKHHSTSDYSTAQSKETILVFGGNGFMGSEVVASLIPKGYKLVLVSRGNWYFDSSTRIQPHVTHLMCDRYEDKLDECILLKELIENTDHFKYVIDFSAYTPKVIKEASEVLEGKVGLYIYISTDSVYEVTAKTHTNPTKETDAVRPEDPVLQKKLAEKDDYGHQKLAGEEFLKKQRGKGGFPYVFLRLPDVIGPRDTTDRWWTYQLWIKFYHEIGVPIFVPPEINNLKLSFVYVKDVAQAVLKVIEKGEKVWDEAFNFAIDKEFTLSHLLLEMSIEMKMDGIEADYGERDSPFYLFPSVFNGPIDISKAKEQLDFQPSPWKELLEETVNFYEDAFFTFPSKRDEAVDNLITHVVPTHKRKAFLDAIEAYKRKGRDTLDGNKDEL